MRTNKQTDGIKKGLRNVMGLIIHHGKCQTVLLTFPITFSLHYY